MLRKYVYLVTLRTFITLLVILELTCVVCQTVVMGSLYFEYGEMLPMLQDMNTLFNIMTYIKIKALQLGFKFGKPQSIMQLE